ncbi:hypothetical protein SS50377_26387 [Spironucleus salmonicida]|uniref:Uncharacterized protein n=1 Tax=Spironucleus salmonicida TaxID=348837 RepID=V6LVM4_9EUKA|nr:hypothetical protein SS50377_26387 [Spironucleus salmonicida]|eukprot:EST47746.1 Hypothetical protein SS50377_12145 [Spironucleus salmonicida]
MTDKTDFAIRTNIDTMHFMRDSLSQELEIRMNAYFALKRHYRDLKNEEALLSYHSKNNLWPIFTFICALILACIVVIYKITSS